MYLLDYILLSMFQAMQWSFLCCKYVCLMNFDSVYIQTLFEGAVRKMAGSVKHKDQLKKNTTIFLTIYVTRQRCSRHVLLGRLFELPIFL